MFDRYVTPGHLPVEHLQSGRGKLPERDVYERAMEQLSAELGVERYADLTAEGRSMSDAAISADIHTILYQAEASTNP